MVVAVADLQWEAIHVSLVHVGGCCHGYYVSRCGEGAVEAHAHGCARFCVFRQVVVHLLPDEAVCARSGSGKKKMVRCSDGGCAIRGEREVL